jgi:hypothetical protein
MTLDEQDKIIEMQARLRSSVVVLNEYDRDIGNSAGRFGVYMMC